MLKDLEFLFRIEKNPKLYIGEEGTLEDIIYLHMGYVSCLSDLEMKRDWGEAFVDFVYNWYGDTDMLSISFWKRIQQHSSENEDAIKQFYQILHCFCDQNIAHVSSELGR